MTIRELGTALRRFWPLSLGVFLVIAILGAVAAFIPADRYRSTEALLLEPRDSAAALQFGAQLDVLAPPVIQQVGSDEFQATVAAQVPEASAPIELSADNEPGTGIVFIHAESTDAGATQPAAEAAADQVRGNPPTNLIDISVLTPATKAAAVSGGRRAVLLFGSLALGLIAAVFAAACAQWLRPRPSSAAYIRDRYGIQVIGEVPQRRRLRTSVQLSNGTASQEIFESFQKLAVNLEILTRPNSVLATTSWAQGEGKTVVTTQLGWALASLQHEVTVIDCDMRRPTVHEQLGTNLHPGVAEIADGESVSAARQQTAMANLEVIPAGAAGWNHPSKVIADALPIILEELEDRFVLIDTPPLFGAETSLIATRVDGVLLVVDARRTHPHELRDALRDLELSHSKVLGAILNRAWRPARRRGSEYYYRARPLSRSSL